MTGAKISQHFLTSQVGTGTRSHCFGGTVRIRLVTSSTVTPSKHRIDGTGLGLMVGGDAPAGRTDSINFTSEVTGEIVGRVRSAD